MKSPFSQRNVPAFSLIEVLSVMAILAILTAVVMPAFQVLKGTSHLTQAAGGIADSFRFARSYAITHNTYVYVGLQEVDGIAPSSSDGVGRVVVAMVGARHGIRPYDSGALRAADLTALSRVLKFDGVHLADASELANGSTMTGRPAASVDLGGSTHASTTFTWPLAGAPEHIFNKVIEFDPQGSARLQTAGFSASVPNYIEIPLVPAAGNRPRTSSTNQAAIQVDGITGAVRIYRP